MIIVKIKAGLGNQMFQYAFGRALAQKSGYQIKYDTSVYTQGEAFALQNDTPRFYSLQAYLAEPEIARVEEVRKLNPPLKRLSRKLLAKMSRIFGSGTNLYTYSEKALKAKDNSYLEGHWTSELYFKDISEIIRKDFSLRQPFSPEAATWKSRIESSKPSVSLHIRRGDYVTDPKTQRYHSLCDINYYQEALGIISDKLGVGIDALNVFVFSDDIEWAKQNLKFPAKLNFVSDPKHIPDYEEIHLMSRCSHHVIANSSFSWWGAWLDPRPEAIVIAPKKWLANPLINTDAVIPERWVRI